jgi:predicted Rossmann fold flavoprotein
MDENIIYDLIIVGGGPAGIMAAISAKFHYPDYKVVILDRTSELGRKMAISGAGRGNLTNANLGRSYLPYYHGDNNLLKSVFTSFGYSDITQFFTDLGVPLYEETKTNRGKIFPLIDHAKTVREILINKLSALKIEVFTNTTVCALKNTPSGWLVETNLKSWLCHKVILAGGGKTYPALGSDGSGYILAQNLGHTIIKPVPSAVSLVSKNLLSHYLQGEKINAKVASLISGNLISESVGEVLFTNYGFSGPAILDISRDVSIRINREGKSDTMVRFNFCPDTPADKLKILISDRLNKQPQNLVAQCLWGLLTQKAAGAFCAVAQITKDCLASEILPTELNNLIQVLSNYQVEISATRGWNEAEFTAGGINTQEINSTTLASNKVAGIYFAGEILDVDGAIGGYNLSWAWASGWTAGKLGKT